jgi:hypothetical protein
MPVVLRQTPDDGRQPMLDMCVHSLCHSLVFVPAGHVAHPLSLLFSRSKDELGAVRSLRWGVWFTKKHHDSHSSQSSLTHCMNISCQRRR